MTLNNDGPRNKAGELLCESCLETSDETIAIRCSTNPEWQYNLCEECAQEYDNRKSVNSAD